MSENLLTIKDLHVQYVTDEATVCAVNGINLTLDKGQTLGLVGETGAGKTTTALSLLRLLPETTGRIPKGEIIFEGKNIMELSEEEMRKIRGDKIAMIFQDPMTALNPVYTVGEQIHESIALHAAAGKIIEAGTAEEVFKGERRHPYTTGLFDSIPNLKVETDRLKPIDGLMPDPANLPKGCSFHPRCEKCMDICRTQEPPVCEKGTHKIACHLYAKEG